VPPGEVLLESFFHDEVRGISCWCFVWVLNFAAIGLRGGSSFYGPPYIE
jgi:hypothetical protein